MYTRRVRRMRLKTAFDAVSHFCLLLLGSSLLLIVSNVDAAMPNNRMSKYLVYPPPGNFVPTKVQVLMIFLCTNS